jgi:hypothetical protein
VHEGGSSDASTVASLMATLASIPSNLKQFICRRKPIYSVDTPSQFLPLRCWSQFQEYLLTFFNSMLGDSEPLTHPEFYAHAMLRLLFDLV